MAPWTLQSLRAGSPILRYGFAVICVAIALGVAFTLQHERFSDVELPFFNMAIAFTTWYAGVGPCAIAILLSTVCYRYFFVEPVYSCYFTGRIGCTERNDEHLVLFVRDNGVGFDMKYSNKRKVDCGATFYLSLSKTTGS